MIIIILSFYFYQAEVKNDHFSPHVGQKQSQVNILVAHLGT
jgi:hypothetical protein